MGGVAQYRRPWLAGAACLVLASCAAQTARQPVPAQLVAEATIPGLAHARFWGDEIPANILTFAQAHMPNAKVMASKLSGRRGRPLVEYLAISGGAGDGAFAAGLLAGWSKKGNRPQFEVVTGVSAGALTAPFAFLGSEYDGRLQQIWTRYETDDLATPQVLAGLFGADAFADSSGLADLIAKYVDRRLLDRIAEEYRKGRVLLVATTNLDAQRPVIWNMGEIAANQHPYALELFRQVILASASVPGAFPPVHIKVRAGDKVSEEMHVDGGPTRQVFVAPAQLSLKTFDRLYPRPPLRRIYIIKNGKLTPEYEAVASNTLAISARSVFTLTKSQSIGDINRIYAMTQRDGAEFRLASIPPSFSVPSTQIFDPNYMKALFQEGYKLGREGEPWTSTPPEASATLAVR
jgi:predicted acylesterase/phospholipase RssA